MTTITIDRIEQKPKKSFVHTTDGRKLGCFNDKIERFGIEPNGSYEADIEMTDYGSLITKARRVAAATAIEAPAQQGRAPTAAPSTTQSHGAGGECRGEEIFVCALLKEAIRAGLVPIDKDALTIAIKHIRAGYRGGFGSNTFTTSEAGTFTSGAARIARG
jgi:hypothetical protein